MGPGSRSRSLSSGGASRRPVGSLVRDDVDEAIFPFNFQTVIPGWSEGPDPESRDSGLDASHRPGMTGSGLLRGGCHRARVRMTRWLAMRAEEVRAGTKLGHSC